MEINKELNRIQKELKAPKSQYNSFGKYSYRNAEDILEAYKKVAGDTSLIIDDEVVQIGDRYYVKATTRLSLLDTNVTTTAYAREPLEKKGMDSAQITGATSSYARKYALNALFAIDDTKDADNFDNSKIEDFKEKVNKITDVEKLRTFFKENEGKGKEYVDIMVTHSKSLKHD